MPLARSFGAALTAPIAAAARLLDHPLRALQRRTGQRGMIAFFLLPNMAIFAVFVLFPMLTNFVYSVTGGNALFLADRSFVGAQHYARLARLRATTSTR